MQKAKIIIGLLFSFSVFLNGFYLVSVGPGGEKGYVSVDMGGQLGNQMFHIAATLAYAWDHGLEARFPDLNEGHNNLSYNRDKIFFRMNAERAPIPLKTWHLKSLNYERIPDDLKNVKFRGGLFSWRFFDHRKEEVLEAFAPSEIVLDKLHDKYNVILSRQDTVGVHVRTYSKLVHDEGLHFVGMGYFDQAFKEFPEDSLFVVFSDRIQWCKAHFTTRFPERNFYFVEGNDHVEDFVLLSLMKHQILSKSTFSWWAAYMNRNNEKIVIAPIQEGLPLPLWVKNLAKGILGWWGKPVWYNEEYYLPSWKLLTYTLEPYPEDVNAYDEESTSVEKRDK